MPAQAGIRDAVPTSLPKLAWMAACAAMTPAVTTRKHSVKKGLQATEGMLGQEMKLPVPSWLTS